MRELMGSGATILLVSHQISLIQSLCKRVLLLNHGELVKDGPADDVVPFYQNITFKKNEDDFKHKVSTEHSKVKINQDLLIAISSVTLYGKDLKPQEEFVAGEDIEVKIDYQARQEIINPIIIVDIIRSDGVLCCSINSKESGLALGKIHAKGSVNLAFSHFNLAPGIYLTKVSFWENEMIHPYIIYSNNIFRVHSGKLNSLTNAVFLPSVNWKL